MSIIIGIDPGYERVGFGIIKHESRDRFSYIDSGLIHTPKNLTQGQRLTMLRQDLRQILGQYSPNELALEALFFFKNAKTVIPVAQARGIILELANFKNIDCFEYTPSQVKLNLTGNGKAVKKEIQTAVSRILNLESILQPDDVSDAVAIAICHCRFREIAQILM